MAASTHQPPTGQADNNTKGRFLQEFSQCVAVRDCRHAALRERPRGAIDHVQLDRDDDQWTRISFVAPFPYEKGIVPYGLESDIEISPGVNKYMGVGGFGADLSQVSNTEQKSMVPPFGRKHACVSP